MQIKTNKKRNYSKEQLIKMLQDKEKELGRTPKTTDMPTYGTIKRHFGSWNNALRMAGLKINIEQKYTKKQLIQILRDKTKKLGRAPYAKEIKEIGSIVGHFGTLNNALKSAKIKINREREYNETQLIQILRDKAKELGKTPNAQDISNHKTIILHFGTWNNALKSAGLKINKKRGYTEEDLIQILRDKTKELGRLPKTTDIKQITPIRKNFGNLDNALKKAGLKPNRQK